MTARRLTRLATLLLAGLLLVGGEAAWAQRGPIKIGLLVPLTGPLAANGTEMENGLKLFLDEQGQRLGGREIRLSVEDTEAKPATALTKARATGGDVEDTAKLLAALRRVTLTDAPRGPVSFDEYGHPIENIYVRRVERVEGKLQNTVIHTFPNVSQFWTYKAEDYLKNPAYSRDWPPCKAC